jgi:hypothetical protein
MGTGAAVSRGVDPAGGEVDEADDEFSVSAHAMRFVCALSAEDCNGCLMAKAALVSSDLFSFAFYYLEDGAAFANL